MEHFQYNWFKRPEKKEPRTGERPNNTEQGFLSLRVQVKRMRDAGIRLAEYKREYFDKLTEDFDDVIG